MATAPKATPLTTDAATTAPVNKPGLGNNRIIGKLRLLAADMASLGDPATVGGGGL